MATTARLANQPVATAVTATSGIAVAVEFIEAFGIADFTDRQRMALIALYVLVASAAARWAQARTISRTKVPTDVLQALLADPATGGGR